MAIKKRLILSNILMLTIPIIVFFLILSIGLLIIKFDRWDSIESIYESKTTTYSAQSLIYSYKDEFYRKEEKNMKIIVKK